MNDYSSVFQPDLSQFMQAPQQTAPVQPTSQTSSYPALPNAYGLGEIQQPMQQQQTQQQIMANSSHGANPWSWVGESNSR